MKHYKLIFAALVLLVPLALATRAFAMMPTLTLTSTGTNQVDLSVYGDPNSPVILDQDSSYSSIGVIGYTNSSGYFSTVLSATSYNIPAGSEVYVIVDGQESSSALWSFASYVTPYTGYTYGYGNGTLSLSQSSISVESGQSTTVTAYQSNGYSYNTNNSLYVSENSNPSVATVQAYGTELTVTGVSTGSTTITVCQEPTYGGYESYGTNSGCATLYVTTYGNYATVPQYVAPTYVAPYTTTVAPYAYGTTSPYCNQYPSGSSNGYYYGYPTISSNCCGNMNYGYNTIPPYTYPQTVPPYTNYY